MASLPEWSLCVIFICMILFSYCMGFLTGEADGKEKGRKQGYDEAEEIFKTLGQEVLERRGCT